MQIYYFLVMLNVFLPPNLSFALSLMRFATGDLPEIEAIKPQVPHAIVDPSKLPVISSYFRERFKLAGIASPYVVINYSMSVCVVAVLLVIALVLAIISYLFKYGLLS